MKEFQNYEDFTQSSNALFHFMKEFSYLKEAFSSASNTYYYNPYEDYGVKAVRLEDFNLKTSSLIVWK